MENFLQGIICAGFATAALFFLRYWRETRDRLFLLFALAFIILALNRVMLAALGQTEEAPYSLYLVRLAAFLLIIAAIVDKNLHWKAKPAEAPNRHPDPPAS